MNTTILTKTLAFLPLFAVGCAFSGGGEPHDDNGSSGNGSTAPLGPSGNSPSYDGSDDDESTSDSASADGDTINFGDEQEADAEEPGTYAIYEDFSIDINQTITMGSFVMTIGQVDVIGSPDGHEPPRVSFTVHPENLDEEPQTPFYAAGGNEDLLLTIGGRYFFGYVHNQDPVPGYLVGESGLVWLIDDPEVTPEEIRAAVITLGPPESNQVVIPLAAPEETIHLNEVPLAPVSLEGANGHLNFTFDDIHLQFSRRSTNSLLERDKAWLYVGGSVLNTTGRTACFSVGDFSITPPSGVSRIAESARISCLIREGEIEEGYVLLEIDAPYPGTYTVGVFDMTFDVVIPEFDL
jgi:hypothetical protein